MLYSTLITAALFLSSGNGAVVRGRQAPPAPPTELSSPDLPQPNGSIGAAASAILAGTAPSPAANPGGQFIESFIEYGSLTL